MQGLLIPESAKGESFHAVIDKAAHIAIVAGARSSAVIFLELHAPSIAMEVFLEEESTLSVVCLQRSAGAVISQRSRIKTGSSLHWHNVTLGEGVQHDLKSELVGRDAVSNIDWIFAVSGKAKQAISARNIFSAENGGGEITLKGVAQNRAKATCYGMIEIAEQGRGTNTYLTEDVLMLDSTAMVDAVPGLEIRTNDVKASHSATVSRVTPEDLFYFQSRGIDPTEARRMYIFGFLSDLTAKIADEKIRTQIVDHIEKSSLQVA